MSWPRPAVVTVAAALPTTLAMLFQEFFRQHAEEKLAPKTIERYRELAAYLAPELLAMPLGEITPTPSQSRMEPAAQERRASPQDQAGSPTEREDREAHCRSGLQRVRTSGEVGARRQPTRSLAASLRFPRNTGALRLPRRSRFWSSHRQPGRGAWPRSWKFAPLPVRAGARSWRCAGRIFKMAAQSSPDRLPRRRQVLEFKGTKTERPRDVKVPASALAALDAHRKRQDEFRQQFGPNYRADLDLIFANPDGTPLRPNSISSVVSLLFRRLGLPKGASLHSLRHSHGSHLVADGVPLPVVSERLGHSSVRTTADVYAHALRGQDDDAARRWDEFQRRGTPDNTETKSSERPTFRRSVKSAVWNRANSQRAARSLGGYR